MSTYNSEMNRLDAVCVSTTSREIDAGYLEKLCDNLNENVFSDIPLLIFTNNSNYKTNISFLYTKYKTISFSYLKLINIDIPTSDDIYHYRKMSDYIPELGIMSGPNIMFFYIMNFCYRKKFDTILLLETDCIVKPNMTSACKEYVENNSFFISGSKYLGNSTIPTNIKDHLNGVAFYRTGSIDFQRFIKNVQQYIKDTVRNGDIAQAYDTSIYLYLKKINNSEYSKYIENNLILNFSPKPDAGIPVEQINLKYPDHVILHKKL
jgi:hypothetical protein